MSIRVTRYLSGRSIDEGDSKPLIIIPYGAGERPRHLRLDGYVATRADSYADQPSEINWTVIDVPWAILLTHATSGYAGGTDDLDTAAEWDTMYRNLLLEYGTDGNEFYGGDPDASTPDVVEEAETVGDEPVITRSLGPSGIVREFSREVLMRPLLSEGANAVRYFDEFNQAINLRAMRESGGCILAGATRYNVDAQTNFTAEFVANQRAFMGPMIGGDVSRVQALIEQNTSAVGDRLRTMLFGGDNYIEADTVKNDDAKAYLKAWCSIETPYMMGAR
jgi:hypothetical protein